MEPVGRPRRFAAENQIVIRAEAKLNLPGVENAGVGLFPGTNDSSTFSGNPKPTGAAVGEG